MSSHQAPVIWITGISGVGKSTLANEIYEQLLPSFGALVKVDGDVVRDICGNDLGFDSESRLKNALRISRLCKFLNDQNVAVVCSTISFFTAVRQWNRQNIPSYVEVYVKASLQELQRRNSKGLYGANEINSSVNVVGIDQALEAPESPDLTIENETKDQFVDNCSAIMKILFDRGYIGGAT